jgi:hypothetical protein
MMKKQKSILKIGGVLIAMLCVTACGETNSNSASQSTTATATPKGELTKSAESPSTASTSQSTTATATSKGELTKPAESPSTTATPKSQASSTSAAKPIRVQFAKGSSSKVIKDSVVRGDRHIYLVGAKKGQQMNLKISSLEKNAVFEVTAPGGKTIQQEATTWNSKLPANGDYQVVVGGTRGNANYELNVEIK